MATVSEVELEQRTGDFINFVKAFAEQHKGDYKFRGQHDGFNFYIIDGDVTLEFSL